MSNISESSKKSRRAKPRCSVSGRVTIHNNVDFGFSGAVNISETGIFLQTNTKGFSLEDEVHLTLEISQLSKSYSVHARIKRMTTDGEKNGLGMEFSERPDQLLKDIRHLADK